MIEPGTLFAERFEIERTLGTGAMGTVHSAFDLKLGGHVAVKVLHRDARGTRFEREARVLSELSHPGVVRYIDHGVTADGRRYLVTEWLNGEDLAERLARAPLTLRASVEVARRVAEALAVAHSLEVVHRDVKPSNIFLVGFDVAYTKLIDFGVARARDQYRTATGTVVGTLSYMAPEQARGDKEVDGRADLFALGCVLYQCVTGAKPFAAATALEVRIKVVKEEPQRVASLRPDLPPIVDALVHQLLAKDPARRAPDALAVAAMLAGLRDLDAPAPFTTTLEVTQSGADPHALTQPESRRPRK